MDISRNLIVYLTLFPAGQLLDYFTTYMGTRGLTKEDMQRRELNPAARSKIHKRKSILAAKVFATGVLTIVFYFHPEYLYWLKALVVFTFITVLSNLEAFWAEKSGRKSDWYTPIMRKFKVPEKFWYLVLIAVELPIALGIAHLLP